MTWPTIRTALLLACVALAAARGPHAGDDALPQPGDVGQLYLNFATSSPSAEARDLFRTGLALQYAFWYDLSRAYFDRALALDPNFAIAAAMDAMSWMMPLWGFQYPERAVPLLQTIDAMDTSRVTDREWMYINATRVLWLSSGPTMARVGLWRNALAEIVAAYPDDEDAVAFLVLSELTLAYPGERGFQRRQDMAAIVNLTLHGIALNEDHAGLIHFLVHASDAPDLAPRVRTYAEKLSALAPDAFHLQHMPTHLYLRMGNWEACNVGNTNAAGAMIRYRRDNRLTMGDQYWDWHSLEFKHYCMLQQRRINTAWELDQDLLGLIQGENPDDSFLIRQRLFFSRFIIETRQWQYDWNYNDLIKCEVCLDECRPCVMDLFDGQTEWVYMANAAGQLAAGLSAANLGNFTVARQCEDTLTRFSRETAAVAPLTSTLSMMALQLRGYRMYKEGARSEGLSVTGKAVSLEGLWNPPPYGPPYPLLPPSEQLGWMLLDQGSPETAREAAENFEFCLASNPMRFWSLVGLQQANSFQAK